MRKSIEAIEPLSKSEPEPQKNADKQTVTLLV